MTQPERADARLCEHTETEYPMIEKYGIKYNSHLDRLKTAQTRSEADISGHVMAVFHDDGVYRHLRFSRPVTSLYWFDVVTWPGVLAIRGDMGTYVFARSLDMFGFFRSRPGYINPGYWAEKVIAADPDGGVRTYSEDMLRESIISALDDHADRLDDDDCRNVPAAMAALVSSIRERILDGDDALTADDAYSELARFAYGSFRFEDAWEMNLRDYSHRFLWCLHAIVWAINTYDDAQLATK